MPVNIPSESVPAVRDSIAREKRITKAKLKKYRERLKRFEEEHGMDTEEFVRKFRAGELEDDEKWFEWKFAYEAHERLMERQRQLEEAVQE